MEFRRLTQIDAEHFFKFRVRGLEVAPSAFGSTVEEVKERGSTPYTEILKSGGDENVIFGAFSDTELTGVIGILRLTRPKTRHRASIWGMFVSPEFQGKGIGGKLLDLAVEHAKRKMGVERVDLTVESTNTSAIKLYESRGFRSWGREPKAHFFLDSYFDEDHMTLDLHQGEMTPR